MNENVTRRDFLVTGTMVGASRGSTWTATWAPAGSTDRGEANLYGLCSFLAVEEMGRGKSPKDAGMEVLRRVQKNTIESRLLDASGKPNFNLSFYLVNKAGDFAGVSMFAGRFAVHTQNGAELRDTEPLLVR